MEDFFDFVIDRPFEVDDEDFFDDYVADDYDYDFGTDQYFEFE